MELNRLIEGACSTYDRIYGYIAPTHKQAKAIAITDPMMFKRYCPREIRAKDFNESDLIQDFITGGKVVMMGAENPDRLRGINFYGVVIEEWATMKHGRVIWEEIIQPVLRENGGWADFIFTPKGRNFAFEYSERAKADLSGDWAYFQLKASESGLISRIELEKAKREMPERLYQQELECEFLEGASSVFHNVERCIAGGLLQNGRPGRKYILGVDLGRTEDFSVLIGIDIGTSHVDYYERFTETSWEVQREKIILAAKRLNNARVVIDASGFSAGSVIAEDLENHPLVQDLRMAQVAAIPFKFTNPSKRALVEKLMVCIEQQLVTFPDIPEFISELHAFTYETTEFGNIRYTAPEGMHDDTVMALGLAVWGLGAQVYAPLRGLPQVHDPRLKVVDYRRRERPKKASLANW